MPTAEPTAAPEVIPPAPARGTIAVVMLPEGWEPDERTAISRLTAKYQTAEVRTYPGFKGDGARLVTVDRAEWLRLRPPGGGELMPLPNAEGTDFEGATNHAQ
jgi:hypothetical protein